LGRSWWLCSVWQVLHGVHHGRNIV
jgi:hypothetical protein